MADNSVCNTPKEMEHRLIEIEGMVRAYDHTLALMRETHSEGGELHIAIMKRRAELIEDHFGVLSKWLEVQKW
jgi:hypothetical protein